MPERGVQNGGGLRGQRLVSAAFEHHAKTFVPSFLECAVRVGFALPSVEGPEEIGIARRVLERLFVSLDGQRDVALVEGDVSQQHGRLLEVRAKLDGPLQTGHRFAVPPLCMQSRGGSHEQHGIVRPHRERFVKKRQSTPCIAVDERFPAGVVQRNDAGLAVERPGRRDDQDENERDASCKHGLTPGQGPCLAARDGNLSASRLTLGITRVGEPGNLPRGYDFGLPMTGPVPR